MRRLVIIVIAVAALLGGASPAQAARHHRRHAPPVVIGSAATPQVRAWVLNAVRLWPLPGCKRVRVFPHEEFTPGSMAASVESMCTILLSSEFGSLEPGLACQAVAHEVRHLRGDEHQHVDASDVMFARADGTVWAGEGWLRVGAVPGCWAMNGGA